MPCKVFPAPGGGFGFACSRGADAPRCSVVGCAARGSHACDWPLSGPRAGQTCSAPLCFRHRARQADGTDLCPTHDRVKRAHAATGQ